MIKKEGLKLGKPGQEFLVNSLRAFYGFDDKGRKEMENLLDGKFLNQLLKSGKDDSRDKSFMDWMSQCIAVKNRMDLKRGKNLKQLQRDLRNPKQMTLDLVKDIKEQLVEDKLM